MTNVATGGHSYQNVHAEFDGPFSVSDLAWTTDEEDAGQTQNIIKGKGQERVCANLGGLSDGRWGGAFPLNGKLFFLLVFPSRLRGMQE